MAGQSEIDAVPKPAPRELRAAVETLARFKRAFATYRLYGFDHERASEMEEGFYQALKSFLEEREDLSIVVGATFMTWKGQQVLEDERRDESVTQPLFADGVESISFFPEIEKEEFVRFLRIWHNAIARSIDVEHSFSTLVWEEDFQNIATGFQPSLAEEGLDPEDRQEFSGKLSRLLNSIASEGGLSKLDGLRRIAVDAKALSVITNVDAFQDLTPQDLQQRSEARQLPAMDLSVNERAALVTSMTSGSRGQGQRTLYALWRLFPWATHAQRSEIVEFSSRIIGTLTLQGRSDDVERAFARIEDTARGSQSTEQYYAEFVSSLGDRNLVEEFVRLTGSTDAADPLYSLLQRLPDDDVDMMFKPMSNVSSQVRAKLVPIVVTKNPPPETLAHWLAFGEGGTCDAVFETASQMAGDHFDMVVRTGLIDEDERIRLRAIGSLKPEHVPLYWSLLVPCATDASIEVRHGALQLLVRSRDTRSIAILAELVEDEKTPPEIWRTGISGLGNIGGPEANVALRTVLTTHREREARVAAALALGTAADRQSVSVLEDEAKRFMGDRAVKRACQEALRRLATKRTKESNVD